MSSSSSESDGAADADASSSESSCALDESLPSGLCLRLPLRGVGVVFLAFPFVLFFDGVCFFAAVCFVVASSSRSLSSYGESSSPSLESACFLLFLRNDVGAAARPRRARFEELSPTTLGEEAGDEEAAAAAAALLLLPEAAAAGAAAGVDGESEGSARLRDSGLKDVSRLDTGMDGLGLDPAAAAGLAAALLDEAAAAAAAVAAGRGADAGCADFGAARAAGIAVAAFALFACCSCNSK